MLLFSSYSLKIDSFDLNESPSEQAEESISVVNTSNNKQGTSLSGNIINKEKLEKLAVVYKKIVKLFSVLKICDDEQFDIERINKVPSMWSEQYKAMMILAKIGKQKLIKKSDMARYKRIMTNCNAIQELAQKRAESKLSLESQMSGMTREDVNKLRKQLQESPIEDLRSLILNNSNTTPSTLASTPIWLKTTTPKPLNMNPINDDEFVITTSGNKRSRADDDDDDNENDKTELKLINFM